jgi:DNA-binding transcriptional MerR regulator
MMRRLAQFKNRKFVGVKELAHEAETLLREMGSEQERGNVSDYPNERTVRFYLSEGLLSQPEEKKGSALIFNYSHLLTLLAIKKLQAQGIPNGFIRSLVVGKPDSELETILREEIKTVTDPDEIVHYARMAQSELNDEFGEEVILRSVLPQTEEQIELGEIAFAAASDEELDLMAEASSDTDEGQRKNKAAEYLRSLLTERAREDVARRSAERAGQRTARQIRRETETGGPQFAGAEPDFTELDKAVQQSELETQPQDDSESVEDSCALQPLFSVSRAIPEAKPSPQQDWTRYEIARGLELHICEDLFSASKARIGRKQMLKIAEILGLTELIRDR